MSTAFCRACGKELEASAAFCNHCGAPQQGDVAASNVDLTTGVASTSWQKKLWLGSALVLIIALIWLGIAVGIPAYHDYQKRAAEVAAEQTSPAEAGTQIVANQAANDKTFRCEDHKDLVTSADPTIRLVDKVGDIPADLRKALGPDIEKSQLLPQKIPGQYLGICRATAYYYDNLDREVFYTVSQVNNGTELFVTIQDIGWLKNDLKFKRTINDIVDQQKREKEEQEKQQADPSKQDGVAQAAQSEQKPVGADSPSFDCTKASNNVERMICGDSELRKLDSQIAEAYAQAKSFYKPDDLKKTQTEWIKRRNACASRDCVLQEYKNRLSDLRDQGDV